MNPARLILTPLVAVLALHATSLQNVVTIDVPGAVNTFPLGGNAGGEIVGYYNRGPGADSGFLYSSASGSFGSLVVPGGAEVHPGGINNSGVIAGTYATQVIDNHFFLRLPNGQYTTFDYPASGYLGTFVSINNNGDLAGSFAPAGEDYMGFIRSAATGMFTTFRIAGAPETEVFGINDLDQVVGRYEPSAGQSIGFIRNQDGSYVTFEVPGQLTLPRGISNTQTVVGTPGFLRTPDGILYTVAVGNFGADPSAVLDGDRVLGWYAASDRYHGFAGEFSPVPEPGTILAGLIGLAAAVSKRRRSKSIGVNS